MACETCNLVFSRSRYRVEILSEIKRVRFLPGNGDGMAKPAASPLQPRIFWKYDMGVIVAEKKIAARQRFKAFSSWLEGLMQNNLILRRISYSNSLTESTLRPVMVHFTQILNIHGM